MMRNGHASAAQFPELAAHGRVTAAQRLLQGSDSWDSPNACNYYGMDPGGDCLPAHSAVVYLVTGVAGMVLLLALTVFFICCLCLRKRRRVQAEAAFLRWQQAQTVQYPTPGTAYFVGTYAEGNRDSTAREAERAVEAMDSKNPSVCVIMAGEEKPTFLAHPVRAGTSMAASEGPKESGGSGNTERKPRG